MQVDEYNRLMEMAGKDSRLNDNTVHRDNEDYDIRYLPTYLPKHV